MAGAQPRPGLCQDSATALRGATGLDTDLSSLGLGVVYPWNVRFSSNTLSDLFDLGILDAANSSEFNPM
jgi:hypothetical protein